MTDRAPCTRCGRTFTRPARRGLCPPCYMATSTRQKAYGRWETVYTDAAPVRAHLEALRAAGVGTRAIAQQSGLARSTVAAILNGKTYSGVRHEPRQEVHRDTAAALLNVQMPTAARHNGNIDATGTRRRLQALIADGHTQRGLNDRLGLSSDNLADLIDGRKQWVTERTHIAIAALFVELQMQPGTNHRARNRGAANSWPLPLDWDDDLIDNPAATADRSTPTRRDLADMVEDFEFLTRHGESAAAACARLGIRPGALVRRCYRAGITPPDVLKTEDRRQRTAS